MNSVLKIKQQGLLSAAPSLELNNLRCLMAAAVILVPGNMITGSAQCLPSLMVCKAYETKTTEQSMECYKTPGQHVQTPGSLEDRLGGPEGHRRSCSRQRE